MFGFFFFYKEKQSELEKLKDLKIDKKQYGMMILITFNNKIN